MRKWTQAEIDYLKAVYPDHSNAYCAEYLHRSILSIKGMVSRLGLKKTPEFYDKQHSKAQFRKGQAPFNKGRSIEYWMSEEGQRNSSRTRYKRGQKPHNDRPAGYEMLRNWHKGKRYWWIKPEDGRRMMPKHRYLWEQAHGSIPKGWCVQFRDGDTTNCVLENLYLISRAKQVRKNFDDLPAERKAETHRKIHEARNDKIKRDRLRLKWGLQPLTKLVKRRPI